MELSTFFCGLWNPTDLDLNFLSVLEDFRLIDGKPHFLVRKMDLLVTPASELHEIFQAELFAQCPCTQ